MLNEWLRTPDLSQIAEEVDTLLIQSAMQVFPILFGFTELTAPLQLQLINMNYVLESFNLRQFHGRLFCII